jgi:hypothetical protein
MLKRLASQIEELKATDSPKKSTPTLQSTPKKEYPFNIIIRKIIDPESKELLAVTLENTYPVLNWIKGEVPLHDVYISAQGNIPDHETIYSTNVSHLQVDSHQGWIFLQNLRMEALRQLQTFSFHTKRH